MHQSQDALKRKLHNAYTLSETQFEFGSHNLLIYSVEDSYGLLDKITDEEFLKDEQMPYWAEIWPSSLVLSHYLLDKVDLANKTCIELGAGVGVVSVASSLIGAKTLCTDISEEALDFMKLNAMVNNTWIEVAILDWRKIRLNQTYDYIFAADVLYERRNHLPILNAIDKLLKPEGKAIVADPERQIAAGFFRMLQENDFFLTTEKRYIDTKPRKLGISIHTITKRTR